MTPTVPGTGIGAPIHSGWTPPVADDPRAGLNGGARPRGPLTRSQLGTATTLAPVSGLRARTVGDDAEPDTGTGMLTATVTPLTTLGRTVPATAVEGGSVPLHWWA